MRIVVSFYFPLDMSLINTYGFCINVSGLDIWSVFEVIRVDRSTLCQLLPCFKPGQCLPSLQGNGPELHQGKGPHWVGPSPFGFCGEKNLNCVSSAIIELYLTVVCLTSAVGKWIWIIVFVKGGPFDCGSSYKCSWRMNLNSYFCFRWALWSISMSMRRRH